MSQYQIFFLSLFLAILIFLGAFFSAAETGLMAINRYRLRHKARVEKGTSFLILHLLKRPDRLLGMILIGNCFANIIASAVTTLLAIHYFGDKAVIVSTLLLALIILIFAEVAPKTVAALYPERVSRWVCWPVFLMLKLFYPLVWLINAISNGLLRVFRVQVTTHQTQPLSKDELRSVVYETSGRMPRQYQDMLLGILDLNKVTVNEVMVPQHQIVGINLDHDWKITQQLITKTTHDWLPVYRDTINQLTGVVCLREVMHYVLTHQALNQDILLNLLHEPYFVPEGTPLNIQLLNFQREHKRTAFVVDEYGEIRGLLTLADILEEIVGEFTSDITNFAKVIQIQRDGSCLVDGAIPLRELNRVTKWELPTHGARTLSGLIIEYLESIPREGTCIKINNYPIEIVRVQKKLAKVARIFPRLI